MEIVEEIAFMFIYVIPQKITNDVGKCGTAITLGTDYPYKKEIRLNSMFEILRGHEKNQSLSHV